MNPEVTWDVLLIYNTNFRINIFLDIPSIFGDQYKKVVGLNWFKLPMEVIDRTKAVTQHFLENSFKKLSIKKKMKKEKSEKHKNIVCLNVCCVMML